MSSKMICSRYLLRRPAQFFATFLLVSLAHLAVAFGGSCIDHATNSPSKVEKIADGVFVRVGVHDLMTAENLGAISNASFVIGEKAVAVIDTGGSFCDGLRLKAAISKHTDLPVKYVISTHVHPDHVFGNEAFHSDGVEFIGHKKLTRAVSERGSFYLDRFSELMGADAIAGTKIVGPTKTVKNTLEIDLGGRTLLLTAQPTAHTDNDLTVFDSKTRTLWTGDLLFQGHLPVVDGKLVGWMKVMDSLAKIKADRAVPGHGPASVPWPDGMAPQKRYFDVLAKDLRKSIALGEFMQDAQMKAAQKEKDKWELFDEFNARNAASAFAELEWE